MTRRELIEQLADRLQVPDHSAQVFLHAFFDVSKSMLRSGETVMLDRLGTWTPEHSEDGTLLAVRYAQMAPRVGLPPSEEVVSGPASSIDDRHFIPADALAIARPSGRSPVDVGDIVTAVQRELVEEREEAEMSDDAEEEFLAGDDYAEEEFLAGDDDTEEEFIAGDDDTEEEFLAGDDDTEEDDAVFHRNRDQLYHPPEERSNRTLLFVALGLTIVVLIIVLSLLFGSDEKARFGDRWLMPAEISTSLSTVGGTSATGGHHTVNTVRLTIQRSI